MIYYSVFFIIFLFSMIEIENKNLAKIFYIPFIFFYCFLLVSDMRLVVIGEIILICMTLLKSFL